MLINIVCFQGHSPISVIRGDLWKITFDGEGKLIKHVGPWIRRPPKRRGSDEAVNLVTASYFKWRQDALKRPSNIALTLKSKGGPRFGASQGKISNYIPLLVVRMQMCRWWDVLPKYSSNLDESRPFLVMCSWQSVFCVEVSTPKSQGKNRELHDFIIYMSNEKRAPSCFRGL